MTFDEIKLGQPFVSNGNVYIKLTGYSAANDRGFSVPFLLEEQLEVQPLPPVQKLINAFQSLTLGTSFIDLARNFGLDREEVREVLAIKDQLKEAGL